MILTEEIKSINILDETKLTYGEKKIRKVAGSAGSGMEQNLAAKKKNIRNISGAMKISNILIRV